MFERIRQLFGRSGRRPEPEIDDAVAEAWADRKSELMTLLLGDEHDMVMHAIIPYAVGGGLDLYYYPNGIDGTGIASKELSVMPGGGPANAIADGYELVMFTRHPLQLDSATDTSTPFGQAHATINSILNLIARYAEQATLNPGDTCEFPEEMEHVGGKCLIFGDYGVLEVSEARRFGLLLVMEVFRSEMDFARRESGGELLERLKNSGAYPYTDLNRPPVA